MWKKVKWALALAAVPAILGYFGCGLDNPDIPDLSGPSELAASLQMRAIPDQLTADGWSSSVIEVTWRNENGNLVVGAEVRFDLGARGSVGASGGTFFDLGNLAPLNAPRPVPGGEEAHAVSAVTDGGGVARVRYWAPFRTDSAADNVVTITARPAGNDFRGAIFRQVDIFLRAADRPVIPGLDQCGISVEPQKLSYLVGENIFFTATQETGGGGFPIARYEWDFGDLTTGVGRTVGHSYSFAGSYTIVLWTTESVTGSISTCTDTIPVR